MSQVLSQDEVDALLKGISGGEIATEADKPSSASGMGTYDLTSQEKVIRGRMPTLDMINDRLVRLMRSSLTSTMRKPVGASITSTDMMKYGDFLETLPVPTSIHLYRMEPLRGNVMLVLESKLVFSLVDILFGGGGSGNFKVEGREFTNIENRLTKRVVNVLTNDIQEAWKNVYPVSFNFMRSEINPQFASIVSPDEAVVVINFELEMENSTGKVSLCIPYSSLEPIKDKLQLMVQSDNTDDSAWTDRFKRELMEVPVEVVVKLGSAVVTGKELLNLNVGDVIQLDTYSNDKIEMRVGNIIKFLGYPGLCRGNKALQIANVLERR